MKRLTSTLIAVAVVFTCGFTNGQEPGPNFEHLKLHRPMIGTWRYEGPLLEDIPGFAEKGTKYVNQISWKWILNRNAVEITWLHEFEGDEQISGKGLIGWHAAEERIAFGGMDSIGGMSLGTIVMEDKGNISTLTSEGIDGAGKPTTFKGVVKKTGKDTLTWQGLERTGGIVEGESPVYTYERVKRAKGKKAAK